MIDTKRMFWISSYPKSGNTWLRLILCGLFFTEDGNLSDFKLLRKITSFDSLANFNFTKDISLDDFNLIVNGKEYNEESVLTYSKYWIEAQKRKIRTVGDLEIAIKMAIKSKEKTLLIVIYNNQNQKRYIGVKLD